MTFIDLFAGIGGFRLGMEMAGHECLGHCEWDKYANRSYIAMHNPKEDEWYADDIRTVRANDVPTADVWCFGFPCQDISVAGKQLGFTGKRSSLFFTVTGLIRDLAEESKPSVLFIENVKNLLSVNGGFDFAKLLIELDEIGYDAEWQVLNSKHFGVPQNRERVFIIGHLRGRCRQQVFPIGGANEKTGASIDIIAHRDGYRRNSQVYNPCGSIESLDTCQGGGRQPHVALLGNVNPSGNGMNGNVFAADGLSPTLTTNKGEGIKICLDKTLNNPREIDVANCLTAREDRGLSNRKSEGTMVGIYQKPRGNNNGGLKEDCPTITKNSFEQNNLVISGVYTNVSPQFNCGPLEGLSRCLKANSHDAGVTDGVRIRKLTPLECFRLQGFPDEYFYRAQEVNSNSQLYKQAGNSVTVNVIYEIARRLKCNN